MRLRAWTAADNEKKVSKHRWGEFRRCNLVSFVKSCQRQTQSLNMHGQIKPVCSIYQNKFHWYKVILQVLGQIVPWKWFSKTIEFSWISQLKKQQQRSNIAIERGRRVRVRKERERGGRLSPCAAKSPLPPPPPCVPRGTVVKVKSFCPLCCTWFDY